MSLNIHHPHGILQMQPKPRSLIQISKLARDPYFTSETHPNQLYDSWRHLQKSIAKEITYDNSLNASQTYAFPPSTLLVSSLIFLLSLRHCSNFLPSLTLHIRFRSMHSSTLFAFNTSSAISLALARKIVICCIEGHSLVDFESSGSVFTSTLSLGL